MGKRRQPLKAQTPVVLRMMSKANLENEEETIMKRSASAVWTGDLRSGKGAISTESGVLSETPYSFKTRFEHGPGTNPEELIGAAHAGCFSMALSLELQKAKLIAERIETKADVTLEQKAGGFAITAVHLTTRAKVPGASQSNFEEATEAAKAGCPVSKLLRADITLDAKLEA
jgi:osmotically inducible protein OsmC